MVETIKKYEPLPGIKTYGVALGMIAYGVLGYLLGYQDPAEAGTIILQGAGLFTVRLGLAKAEV